MRRLLVIGTTPRTGGNMLRGDILGTRAMGDPGEWFNMTPGRHYDRFTGEWGVRRGDLDSYLEALFERTASPNGVASVKLYEYHLQQMVRSGMLPPDPGRLRRLAERFGDPDPVIVTLSRHNKLRQAISLQRARATGKWGDRGSGGATTRYRRRAITAALVELAERENRWYREMEASGYVSSLDLVYETLVPDRETALLAIARSLGLPDPEGIVAARRIPVAPMRRQAGDETESWVNRFIGWR